MADHRKRNGNPIWRWKRFLSQNLLYLASFVLLSLSLFFYLKAEAYRNNHRQAETSTSQTNL